MNPKRKALVDHIAKLTSEGLMDWHDTLDEDSFRAHLGNGMVRITRGGRKVGPDDEDISMPVHAILVMNEQGLIVDEFEEVGHNGSISSLLEMARQRARGADDIYDSMLKDRGKTTAANKR